MTPLQAASHERHRRFHQTIADRAARVSEPRKVVDMAVRAEPNPEPEWWYCMWFADLVSLQMQKPPGNPTVEYIQRVVAKSFGITKLDLISQRRTANLVLPRQIAVYLSKMLTTRSLPEIGRRFGGRDHTTMLYSVEKIRARCVSDPELAARIEALRAELR